MAGFRGSFERTVRWAPVGGEGLEHLSIKAGPDGVHVRSVVIGERGGAPYGIRYEIAAGPDWAVRGFSVESTDGGSLAMTADTPGVWRHGNGAPEPSLAGALDIDLAGTPFTNTLPIRRQPLRAGESREFRMLYVPFDTLLPVIDEQRYTCIEAGRAYLFEAVDHSFSAQLAVDADGLVMDYPTLFRRLA